MCQNLITHGHPNKGQDIEYNPQTQNIMDLLITNTNTKVTSEGDNFGQRCILLKKLNKYKERGSTAEVKNIYPLHQRT